MGSKHASSVLCSPLNTKWKETTLSNRGKISLYLCTSKVRKTHARTLTITISGVRVRVSRSKGGNLRCRCKRPPGQGLDDSGSSQRSSGCRHPCRGRIRPQRTGLQTQPIRPSLEESTFTEVTGAKVTEHRIKAWPSGLMTGAPVVAQRF